MEKLIGLREHDKFIVEQLKKDPNFLKAYFKAALSDENEDPRVVLDMLRNVDEALWG